MDKDTTASLWPPESTHVQSTSLNPAQLREKVLPPSRCLSIWRGCHTLIRGRSYNPLSRKTSKTSLTSNRILLSNVHPNWAKLWYLQQRIASCDEGIIPLVPISSLDQRALHNPNRPHKSYLLESSQETRSETRPLAHRPRGVWLRNGTHPWKHKWPSRCAITPSRNRQRREWQPRRCNDSPTPHQICHHTRIPIKPVSKECSTRTLRSPHCRTPRKRWNT